ncbi:myb/SANT-like DNA-binding domain-containing protein 4 isoform X2 [Nilaparvata lugens]|uniref:myb/SANT-like DNA-binding domain-containing protein 4 isoform X2 n=1 Tax=Nilaparvata lugens TaxID=108931 RepID=UPI00193D0396|nr:myb/SANT-like DNA-binding domain-containing protein 4 isoform X2 [Nilaparvata lugens]
MAEKRERGPNFTEMEKSQLLEIVLKYKDIIENKKTDKVSLLTKNNTWKRINKEYNAIQRSTGIRELKTLKALYECLKAKARKDKAAERIETMKTGRGSCTSSMGELSSRLIRELGEQFQPLQNEFDSISGNFEKVPDESEAVKIQLDNSADVSIRDEQIIEEPIVVIEEPQPNEGPAFATAAIRKRRRISESDATIALEEYARGKVDVSRQKLDLFLIQHQKRIKILNLEEEAAEKKMRILEIEEKTAKNNLKISELKEETAKMYLEKEKVELEISKIKLEREKL